MGVVPRSLSGAHRHTTYSRKECTMISMRMMSFFYTVLILSPQCWAFESQHVEARSEVDRQFSDDQLVNYFGWGFVAGLMDYFIRQQLSPVSVETVVEEEAMTEAVTEAVAEEETVTEAPTTLKKVRKQKKQKKQKKNKKNRAQNLMKKKDTENKVEKEFVEETITNV